MEPRLKTLIVDHEYPAREHLRTLLRHFPEVEVVGEATNASEALQLLNSLPYSLLFLDVSIPGTSGLDLARKIQKTFDAPPWIVFTSATQDHALEAFTVNAVDYLLKPLDDVQLERALSKISFLNRRTQAVAQKLLVNKEANSVSQPTTSEPKAAGSPVNKNDDNLGKIPLHKADKTLLVDENDIFFAKSDAGYVYIKLENDKLLSRYTLKELEDRLNPRIFYRTHRCYLVNLRKVKELIPDFKGAFELVVNDPQKTRIPVSRRRAKRLRQLLGM